MTGKRILYFHQHFSTRSGATGTRSYEFAKKLIEKGYQVTMVAGSNELAGLNSKEANKSLINRFVIDDINVIQIHIPYSNLDSFVSRALKFLKFALVSIKVALSEECDLFFATSTPLTISIPAIVGKFFRNKPFIFEVRDLWPELPREMKVIKNPLILKMLDILETVSYKYADHVIGLSPGIVKGIKKKCEDKKVTLIPNGCDLDLFFPIEDKSEIPGVNQTDFVLIFTGAHGIANGLHNIVDVADRLKDYNDIKFVFVGAGKMKQSLIELANNKRLKNCLFLDPVKKSELNEYLSRADLGLMVLDNIPAFYYGTSPNKFFDYISAGLPIINNYPGWLADMINEYKIGFFTPPSSPDDFAKQVLFARDNKDMLKSFGENSRKLASANFNRNDLAENFCTVIESYAK